MIKMVGITAEQAREMAIGAESTAVAKVLTQTENYIAEQAENGHLSTQILINSSVTEAVRDRLINILQSRNFKVENHPTAIRVFWGE